MTTRVPSVIFEAGCLNPDGNVRACSRSATRRTRSKSSWKCLRIAAREVADGTLTVDAIAALPDTAEAARSRELPGIGPWSAHLVLLRGFGWLDAVPPGDVGVARGLVDVAAPTS